MEKIKLNEEQIEEYVDVITNFQHILNDILTSVENGEIDEMQLSIIEDLYNKERLILSFQIPFLKNSFYYLHFI